MSRIYGSDAMSQELINWGLGIISTGFGALLKTMWDSHRQLETKVAGVEVLVAGQYVRRDELTSILNRMDHKLDAISIKLDTKVDK
jgi:hypothetical protein